MNTFLIKVIFALCMGLAAGIIAQNVAVGAAFLAGTLLVAWAPIYVRYAQDNPKNLWFKRKMFGWGWTPVTWQGWAVIAVYALAMIAFAFTIDENSPTREVFFTFIFPATLLTVLLIRICYRKGESPRWQWGKDLDKYE